MICPERPSEDNIDGAELAKFVFQKEHWWDPKGDFMALHDINPVRLDYIENRAGLSGKRVLDVGCGGGILTEAMARKGGHTTGIDLSRSALSAAQKHGIQSGLSINYARISAEKLAASTSERFDIVTCMELIEHVPSPASLIQACSDLTRPGGDLFFATLNRTPAAYLLVILAAEYIFGIIHKGMHRYQRFVKPRELQQWGEAASLAFQDLSGLRYIPFIRKSGLCRGVSLNYMMHFKKR